MLCREALEAKRVTLGNRDAEKAFNSSTKRRGTRPRAGSTAEARYREKLEARRATAGRSTTRTHSSPSTTWLTRCGIRAGSTR